MTLEIGIPSNTSWKMLEKGNWETRKHTCGSNKSKQEVESSKGELGSSLGLGDIIEETKIREERDSKELRGYTLRVNAGCPGIHRQEPTSHSEGRN